METGERKSTYCRRCKGETLHEVVCTRHRNEEEQVDPQHALDHESNSYRLECVDCATLQVRTTRYTQPTEWWVEEFIPPHPVRLLPEWAEKLPPHARDVLREVHEALAAKHYWLVGMGSRTLIDMFALERIGDQG